METNRKKFDDFIKSITYLGIDHNVKNDSIFITLRGSCIEIEIEKQTFTVTGNHAELTLSMGSRLGVYFCLWRKKEGKCYLHFKEQSVTCFTDKIKALIILYTVLPGHTFSLIQFEGKKVICYKKQGSITASLYVTKDISLYAYEAEDQTPKIKKISEGSKMEDKLKDPDSAEKEMDKLEGETIAGEKSQEEDIAPKRKPVYGDAVEQE